ncbi:MAG TPA: hypothetical protein PK501_06925 [Thiotrichales bacterium]|nr:hypothetical protein [Thiotrichales bacterium]
MSMVRMKIDPTDAQSWSSGRCDIARVDATTEKEIAKQIAQDDQAARQDAAQFTRSVGARLGIDAKNYSSVEKC